MRKLSINLFSERLMLFMFKGFSCILTAFDLTSNWNETHWIFVRACMLQPNCGPSLPLLLFICDSSSSPLTVKAYGWCGKVPPPSLFSVGKGGIDKGNSWRSSTVTAADTLEMSMFTHASVHAKNSSGIHGIPLLLRVMIFSCLGFVFVGCRGREGRGLQWESVVSCSDRHICWTAILLTEKYVKCFLALSVWP